MKRIFSLLIVLVMVCGMLPVVASAADQTVTLTFDAAKANRTSFSTTKQVWAQNGITFTNDKGASNNNVADYANPVRLYASSTITIEYPGMTKLVLTTCRN